MNNLQDDAADGDSVSKPKQQKLSNEVDSAGDIEMSHIETATTATLMKQLLAVATQPLPVKTIYQYELEVGRCCGVTASPLTVVIVGYA